MTTSLGVTLHDHPIVKDGGTLDKPLYIVSTICGDPRHNVRSINSQLREHTARDLFDGDFLDEIIARVGLKDFNQWLNHWIKCFNTTPAGGRYSADAMRYYRTVLAIPGGLLIRHYLGEHETDQCAAAALGTRIDRQEGLELTLADLKTAGIRNQVEVFNFNVRTVGSRVEDVACTGVHAGTGVLRLNERQPLELVVRRGA